MITNKPIHKILFFIIANVFSFSVSSQEIKLIKPIYDNELKTPIPFSSITILDEKGKQQSGTISNEEGIFSVNLSRLKSVDSLRIEHLGYATKTLSLTTIQATDTVYLTKQTLNLNEVILFSKNIDPVEIIENVLTHKENNYIARTSKQKIFFRATNKIEFLKKELILEKHKKELFTPKLIDSFLKKIPNKTNYYFDSLNEIYTTEVESDSGYIKINPLKSITLEDKKIDHLVEIGKFFENLFNSTPDNEYWKLKSGIFSTTIDKLDSEKDSTGLTKRYTNHQRSLINFYFSFTKFSNKEYWEFLHKPKLYEFKLVGGIQIDGETAYIITFNPKKKGLFIGTLYISSKSFALLRADFQYDTGKIGENFKFIGISYEKVFFGGSLLFKKIHNTYMPKYFTYKSIEISGINRNVTLLKKKKRFLFDKKINQIKTKINFKIKASHLIELAVFKSDSISESNYNSFKQPKFTEVIPVKQYNDSLWTDYDIIEPSKQMKVFKVKNRDY